MKKSGGQLNLPRLDAALSAGDVSNIFIAAKG